MRVLLDTNVLVRAITRPAGPARELVLRIRDGHHTLLLSRLLLDELQRVLSYPRVQAKTTITAEEAMTFRETLAGFAELVDVPSPSPALSTDPNDNAIIQAAVVGRADVLCTLDRHFYDGAVVAYCQGHGVRVLGDVELLAALRASYS